MLKLFRSKGKGDPGRDRIMGLLEKAQVQRSKFHLVFDDPVTSIRDLSCSLVDFDERRIRLELGGIKEAGASWIGRDLTVYFMIVEKTPRLREVFHCFRTRIADSGLSRHGLVLLDIDTPGQVSQDQRRRSLRIGPDMSRFAALTLWAYNSQGGFDLSSPGLRLADFQGGQVRLANISAGGLRLIVKGARLREIDEGFRKGSRLIVYIKVGDAPASAPDECWLIAKAASFYEEFTAREAHIGLEFIAQGRLDPQTQKVVWKKVKENVIEDIATWTYQWHLDLYRDKGLGPL